MFNTDTRIYVLSFLLILLCFLSACNKSSKVKSKKTGDNTVSVHLFSNPDKLNPVTYRSGSSAQIMANLFQPLLELDPETNNLSPVLAISRPEQQIIRSGKYKGGTAFSFEIKSDAVWDNNSPITAYDYIFTIKSILNPKVNAIAKRSYFSTIKDVIIDKNNDKKFTVITEGTYILSEAAAGSYVLPEYHYDPEKIMRKFSIEELSNSEKYDKLKQNKKINEFANSFNSEKYQRESEFVSGSGPYRLEKWVTGQYVNLEKKSDWWGNNYPELSNSPDAINYLIITHWTSAIAALKDEAIDVSQSFKEKDFIDLKKNKNFLELYDLKTSLRMSYEFIGFNCKNPILKEKKVREAIAHLLDIEKIIDVLLYGYATPTNSPVHISKPYYNKSLKNREFDLLKAKKLLQESGWQDLDGNGLLEKKINGVKTEFKLDIIYNSGNTRRENLAVMLMENAKKIGIEIQVTSREHIVMIKELRKHQFDLCISAFSSAAALDDLKQGWHTESANGGSNYYSFGNRKTDDLIEKIRFEVDEKKRNEMYLNFQEILHDEIPCIFLYVPRQKFAFHKRFENQKLNNSGYDVKEWKLSPEWKTR